jgi:flagellar biosynthesis/type III secretory pathway protein FliH
MGRVIKAGELRSRLDPVGRPGQRSIEALVAAHGEASELERVARERIVELAITMARRIVGEAVALDPALLDRLYERSLAEVGELAPVTIHVHPDDRAASKIDELARRRGVEVTDDPAVGRSGCRVEATGVVLDASLEAALGALRAELRGAIRG